MKSLNRFELTEYYKTEHWQAKSKQMRVKIGRCQLCNCKTNLHVHHNCYDNLGHENDLDLIVLCQWCHEKHHGHKTEQDLMW